MDHIEDFPCAPSGRRAWHLRILEVSFAVIRVVGEGIIRYITDPIFNALWMPLLEKLNAILGHGYMQTCRSDEVLKR